jgi:hypothetical protein
MKLHRGWHSICFFKFILRKMKNRDLFEKALRFATCKMLSIGVNEAVFARKIY